MKTELNEEEDDDEDEEDDEHNGDNKNLTNIFENEESIETDEN